MRKRAARPIAALLDAALGALPPLLALRVARSAGAGAFRLLRERRAVALENLRLAYGESLDAGARECLARASFRHAAQMAVEIAFARRVLSPRGRRAARLRYPGNRREVLEAARRGGGILVTPHLGNWEVGALCVRWGGLVALPMARPLDAPVAEALLTRWRGVGEQRLPKAGGIHAAHAHLRAGGWLALLADQNAGRHGLFVPFFGLAASTFPTPVALALRTGLPLYLGVCLRRPGAPFAFDMHTERVPVPGPEAGAAHERVAAGVADLTARVEAWVRRAPEQYQWLHRRWKLRPPGAVPGPAEPAYGRFARASSGSRAGRQGAGDPPAAAIRTAGGGD